MSCRGTDKARVAVDQAAAFGWHQYVGLDGEMIAMQALWTSAPLKHVVKKFGFMPERVVAAAKAQL